MITIPEMTDPLGKYWKQPSRDDIAIDESCAMMSQKTLGKLEEYSCSVPSGVYLGKMWKCKDLDDNWHLRWYHEFKGDSCIIRSKLIVII